MANRGRPVAKNPRVNRVTIRMTDTVFKQLMDYNEATGQTITDTMLEALDLLMKKTKKA